MQEDLVFTGIKYSDLNLYHCGRHDCLPGHSYGPAVRDHYLIHYILNGKGVFHIADKEYHLEQGQGFLIFPGTVTFYQADASNPWEYCWVGFSGLKSGLYLEQAGLTLDNPVFTYKKDTLIREYLIQMVGLKQDVSSREPRLLGILYLFLSLLIETNVNGLTGIKNNNSREYYLKRAVEFIEKNYSRKISISEISQFIGIVRSYLHSIFKQYLNLSPQQFLINYRINKACELMDKTGLSIGDIARSVGYDDPLLFSKEFKKAKSMSPREYRKTKGFFNN